MRLRNVVAANFLRTRFRSHLVRARVVAASLAFCAVLPGAPVAHADTLLLGASTATSTYGQPVLFQAQVSPAQSGPSVEFSDGATTLATASTSNSSRL
jgi:hypothetical protein